MLNFQGVKPVVKKEDLGEELSLSSRWGFTGEEVGSEE